MSAAKAADNAPPSVFFKELRAWIRERLRETNARLRVVIQGYRLQVDPVRLGSGESAPFLIQLAPPSIPANHPDWLTAAAASAQTLRADHFVTWNLRDTCLWQTPKKGTAVGPPLKKYATFHEIPATASPTLDGLTKEHLHARSKEIVADLANLQRDGHLHLVEVDATFFVNRLEQAVNVVRPWVEKSLNTQTSMDAKFRKALNEWASRQGIANFGDPAFFESVARQVVYRLLGKVIFYQALRRQAPQLPELELLGLDPGRVVHELRQRFQQARQIDYQAVFEEDFPETVPFPQAAVEELAKLTHDLNQYNFSSMAQDVVGEVFERLIPPDERHGLGQYFTREDLCDLMLAFCVRSKDDNLLDPTFGTGTFLLRGYDAKWCLGQKSHQKLLSSLWGIDIAPFPAELAVINLFRQNLSSADNFPRVVCRDFFEVKPGDTFQFPPPRLEDDTTHKSGAPDPQSEIRNQQLIDEAIPVFDAAVGNFPFVRQELIEKSVPGYKRMLARVLAEDWLAEYPDLFVMKERDRQQFEREREQGMDLSPYFDKVEPSLSGLADLYAYLFFHVARFVKPGGRLAFITSNAWLDVGYGYELQKFFLRNFRIIAILESRCEPWFDQAAVNTIVTILERLSASEIRNPQSAIGNHLVRFVKVKKPLTELIPWDMKTEGLNRHIGLGKLAQSIEAACNRVEPTPQTQHTPPIRFAKDDNFRVRAVSEADLLTEIEAAGKTVKWGRYLRAPDVFFDLLSAVSSGFVMLGEIAPPAFGSKTELNEFFHLDKQKIANWRIEEEYALPLFKVMVDTDHIPIKVAELPLKVFICREDKDTLRAKGHTGALGYIEWGEKQTYTSGRLSGHRWADNPFFAPRHPGWWALPKYRTYTGRIFFTKAYSDRFLQRFSSVSLIPDQRLYTLAPQRERDAELLAAVLNTTLGCFLVEATGSVTLGEGVLELSVEQARDDLLMPDLGCFSPSANKRIVTAFQPLLTRPIESIFKEVEKPDRQALDAAVLEAMGLDPEKWLKPIYDGLCSLVEERVSLGKKRTTAKRQAPKRQKDSVKEQALTEIRAEADERFPDDFWEPAIKSGPKREVHLPTQPYRRDPHQLGGVVLVNDVGETYTAKNKAEADYILYAQNEEPQNAEFERRANVPIPSEPIAIFKTVKRYEQHLRDLRKNLLQSLTEKTLDHRLAARLCGEVWEELGLPEVEE